MSLVALIVGVVLIVSAIRNSQGALFTALGTDVPAFVVWGAAILALGMIGFIPGLKPISRGLLALVFVVIFVRNYAGIIAGFKAVSTAPAANAAQSTSTAAAPANSNSIFGTLDMSAFSSAAGQ